MTTDDRVRDLNDRAVRLLIDAHKRRSDEPLVLAVRYGVEDPHCVRLLEILHGFPGSDEDELLVTEFEPSAQLRILGTLRLALCSPAQLRSAVLRNDAEIAQVRDGVVVHQDGSEEAASLVRALGL